jgi:integrating conjugative element protein (TIGR03765 family)
MTAVARRLVSALLAGSVLTVVEAQQSLTVVQDVGGVSALPYYRALHLLPSSTEPASSTSPADDPRPSPPPHYEAADVLPTHSTRLSPGSVPRRIIAAPGLSPIFLIGDDPTSRAWLQQHVQTLRAVFATGLVVNVDTPEALRSLRILASGLTLSAVSGDDLAQRLGIEHYPVLITSTGIEQ